MGMIPKHEQLQSLGDQELINRYDAEAQNTVVGTGFYRDELFRRVQAKQTNEMLAFTRHVRNLTVVITLLTIANVILVAVALTQ